MTALACVVLLAASTSVELVDEVYQIAPAEWKYVEVNLRQNPALVAASFDVQAGSEKVRLALMTRGDLENLRADLPRRAPQRQLTVIVLAFAFFFGVVTYSARKLLRAAKRT